MVCIGIPVLRPLFSRWFPVLSGSSGDRYNRQNSEGGDGPVYTMHTIGGKVMKGRRGGDRGLQDAPAGSGLRSPTTKTRITAQDTHGSEEEILGSVHRRGGGDGGGGGGAAADQGVGIFVREDVRVDYDSDRGVEHS